LAAEAPSQPAPQLSIDANDVIIVRQSPSASTPLYYRICPDTVEIDHDLERLARDTDQGAGLNRTCLLHFVWRGRPLPGQTLYAAIQSLGTGQELVCLPGQAPSVRRYWWPLHYDPLPVDPEALHDEAFARIDAAVMRHTAYGAGAGKARSVQTEAAVLLSGGVDSSLVAALARSRDIPLTAFTVAFEESYGLNETEFACRVAQSLRIPHHIVHVGLTDVETLLRQVIAAPQPRAAPTAVTHTALVESVARAGHVRLVSGLGADECFGGYHKPLQYVAAQMHQLRKRRIDLATLFALPLARLMRMRETLFPGVAEFFSMQELVQAAHERTMVRDLPVADLEFYRGLLAAKPGAHPLELMAAHEYQYRVSELLLPAFATDQISLAYPFLDPALYLWASALDAGLCYWHEDGAWWAKRLLRTTAGRLLPDEIVMRKRQVFLAPLAHWLLAASIRSIVLEEIADSTFWKLGVLRSEVRNLIVKKLRRYRTLDPDDDWQEKIWILLVLCAWINRREGKVGAFKTAADD
jgi:asparagine synthetase B (glutamine-hydrolysing)